MYTLHLMKCKMLLTKFGGNMSAPSLGKSSSESANSSGDSSLSNDDWCTGEEERVRMTPSFPFFITPFLMNVLEILRALRSLLMNLFLTYFALIHASRSCLQMIEFSCELSGVPYQVKLCRAKFTSVNFLTLKNKFFIILNYLSDNIFVTTKKLSLSPDQGYAR